jgi:perosamine synthetase
MEDRDKVFASLLEQGIGCALYFAPIHLQPAYAGSLSARQAKMPVTEAVAERTLALPFFNRLSFAEQTEVAHALDSAIRTIADAS